MITEAQAKKIRKGMLVTAGVLGLAVAGGLIYNSCQAASKPTDLPAYAASITQDLKSTYEIPLTNGNALSVYRTTDKSVVLVYQNQLELSTPEATAVPTPAGTPLPGVEGGTTVAQPSINEIFKMQLYGGDVKFDNGKDFFAWTENGKQKVVSPDKYCEGTSCTDLNEPYRFNEQLRNQVRAKGSEYNERAKKVYLDVQDLEAKKMGNFSKTDETLTKLETDVTALVRAP
ncbi:MAG: hypothetical protein HY832_04025 [Candidatus Aenigmarchaeota archaeon]|nr:hypothetical protein [Candidatus Aenigmarchaeota archaeon]